MASIECERKGKVAVQLSSEQKASLDNLIKCTEKSLVSEDIAKKSRAIVAEKECLNKADANALQLSVLAGALSSEVRGSLSVFNSKLWKGYIVKDYTDPLDDYGDFVQAALFGGVTAAVVYGGKNNTGVECGWLLAWSDDGGRKVYAECGPRSKFDNINWSQIEEKLNESDSLANATDSETGTSVNACIAGQSAGSGVIVIYAS